MNTYNNAVQQQTTTVQASTWRQTAKELFGVVTLWAAASAVVGAISINWIA
ncbi:hypothetical protein [Vibrio porteresiae]|uniref:Uncharacterized protein n=1 Tax=Vibrio porteresiae DSM 19223 TaxID=1123496 RepID=A0ABZ0QE03_9VIBR|nr:hypothetical protein [Vibrio porteresiae]WPC74683.1 hypothetical protein R8Z52_05550 [Vibrio porteresiae DSM 19223]